MSYQFGTNWSAFSDKTGPVIGPLMAYEVLTAFFLEAGFLGVMLFGLERVGHRLHFLATLMVAIGTLISAFWILSANSWMQTPAGYAINADGQFIAVDWFKVIFNPSFPYRLVHMVLAAYLTTALVVGAVGAFHLLRDSRLAGPRVMFSMAMGPAGFIAVLAGWVTTETGRQPFTVYGLLRTVDSASPLAAPAVASSLIAFIIVYFAVFSVGVIYILRMMAAPPHAGEQGPRGDTPARAAGITPAQGRT
jgi:cytochrome bd-type quinol oxidase subunit 1